MRGARSRRPWIARDVPEAVGFFERSAGSLRAMLLDDTLRMSLVPYAEGRGAPPRGRVNCQLCSWLMYWLRSK